PIVLAGCAATLGDDGPAAEPGPAIPAESAAVRPTATIAGDGTTMGIDEAGGTTEVEAGGDATGEPTGGDGVTVPEVAAGDTLIVFDGDSLTYGTGAGPGEDYPSVALQRLPGRITAINVAVPGQEWGDMLDDAAGEIDPLLAPAARHNIVVVWAGTNDLNRTHTAKRIWAEIERYCRDRRLRGWKVVILTVLSRIPTRSGSRFERQRRLLNHAIRERRPAVADAVADVAHDKRIGDYAGFAAAQYKSDGIHNNAAGNAVIAEVVVETLRPLLADDD
ncbi:MAG: SGNH/GDSL hydrolase family protein, partial [Actinobacteria bacterium]|nr:SGNH/GDSL hydrolase family protein [Actinomycetota bacterium]